MQQNYEEVPFVISCKDLDYLTDMYNWNFNASKLANHFASEVEDEEILEFLDRVALVHLEHAKKVLDILQ